MQSFTVVKPEVLLQSADGVRHLLVIMQIDFFILHAPPSALDEDIVQCATTSIHTDPNAASEQTASKSGTGELRALIRIENLRLPQEQGPLQRTLAEGAVEGD